MVPCRVVSACAGSGKTRQLIGRIMRLLAEDAEPASILAITFTNKAAAEILERLHNSLQVAAEGGEGAIKPEEGAPDRLPEFWRNLRRRILLKQSPRDVLHVHTFHSWFLSLRDIQPRKSLILTPPEIAPDEAEIFDEAWLNWQRRVDDGKVSDDLPNVLKELSPSSLGKLCRSYIGKRSAWQLAPERHDASGELKARRVIAGEELRDAAADFALTKGSGAAFEKARNAAQRLAGNEEGAEEAAQAALLTLKGTVRIALAKAAYKAGAGPEFDQFAEKLIETIALDDEIRAEEFDIAAQKVCEDFAQEWEYALDARVNFDGLEMNAWRMLQDDMYNALSERMHSRYRHILIDEFQDTSPLQWQIVHRWLLDAHGSDDAPSVFIVGDVKQAIYGFRHGDWRLFDVARNFLVEYYHAEAKDPENVCWRCSDNIIKLVNETFAGMSEQGSRLAEFAQHESGPDAGPGGYIEWHGLVAPKKENSEKDAAGEDSQDHAKKQAAVRWPLSPPDVAGETSPEKRAKLVADKVEEILDSWEIPDSSGLPRRCRPEDILILMRNSTHVVLLAEALAGKKIHSASAGFFQTFECGDMLDLAELLLSPHRDYPMARVLKSPVFAVDDVALAALAASPGDTLWEKLQKWPQGKRGAPKDSLCRARILLKLWRRRVASARLPAYDLLARIFRQGNIIPRYLSSVAKPRRQQTAANLGRFLDMSLEKGSSGKTMLGHFVVEMRRGQEDSLQQQSADDGVRMLTIHKAKGLESPVVILADFDPAGGGRSDSADMLISWPPESPSPDRCVISLRKARRAHGKLRKEKEMREKREEANLLYVALTRARHALVIFAPKEPKEENPESWVKAGMERLAGKAGDGPLRFGESFKRDSPASDEEQPQTTDAASEATWRSKTASPAQTDRTETAQKSVAAVRGTIRHRIAALLATKIEPGLARKLAPGEPAQWGEAETMLETPELNTILQGASEVLLEREFSIDGDFVRIDLVALGDKESWVIDYKGGGSDLEKHHEQLRKYRAVVQEEFNAPVRVAILDVAGKFTEINNL